MTAPDRIWTSKCGRALVTIHPRWADDVEYIRAELAAPAALSPEVRALVEAAEAQLQYMDMCNDKGDLERNLRAAVAALRGIGGGK